MKRSPYTLILVVILVIVTYIARRSHSGSRSLPSQTHSQSPMQTNGTAAGVPQAFDFYLLNLSWSPEFCSTHPGKPECARHLGFVLHGLWPQNTNGTYPERCSTDPGPADPAQYSDIYPDQGLLEHEWQTHGTCSGLGPDAFLTLARQAVHAVAIPKELTTISQQTSMAPSDIVGLFEKRNPGLPAASLAVSCGNNYLTAIEVCMNKSLQPIDCGSIRSCRASTIRVPPPQ